jgi:hypothetical protein
MVLKTGPGHLCVVSYCLFLRVSDKVFTANPNGAGFRTLYTGLRIRIRIGLHYFWKLEPDPHDPQVKIEER